MKRNNNKAVVKKKRKREQKEPPHKPKKRAKVPTINLPPNESTNTSSNFLRIHTDGFSTQYDEKHIQQAYIDNECAELQQTMPVSLDVHTILTIIEKKDLQQFQYFYAYCDCVWNMMCCHCKVKPDQPLQLRSWRVSKTTKGGVENPMIRYIMKRQLVLQQYLTEGNKSILQAGNFNAIFKKLCSDLEEHEKQYLNVLQEHLIPIKSRKVMTSETRARYFVLAMEIKQLTLAILKYFFSYQ